MSGLRNITSVVRIGNSPPGQEGKSRFIGMGWSKCTLKSTTPARQVGPAPPVQEGSFSPITPHE